MSTYWQVLWWDYPSAQVLTYKNAHTHARTLTHTNNEAQVFLGLAYTLAVCHVSVSRANSRQHTYKKKTKHKSTQSYSLEAGLEPAQALMCVFKSHTHWDYCPPGLECQNECRDTVHVYVQVCVCMTIYPNCWQIEGAYKKIKHSIRS